MKDQILTALEVEKICQSTIEQVRSILDIDIISVFLKGSYANDYAIPTSDIDLLFVLEEELSKEKQIELFQKFPEGNLDLGFISLGKLKELGSVDLQTHARFLFGKNIQNDISRPKDLDEYIYKSMHGSFLFMERTRKNKPYHYPLEFPKPEDEFKGYAWRRLNIKGIETASIKEMVVLTGWMASSLITWKGRIFVPSKKECPGLFEKIIGGEVADSFAKITHYCRNIFHYKIPSAKEDRRLVRDLCDDVLKIENYFLKEYLEYLSFSLQTEKLERRLKGAEYYSKQIICD